jgi:hypothetical protein
VRPDVVSFVDLEANSVCLPKATASRTTTQGPPVKSVMTAWKKVCHQPAVARYDTSGTVENDCGRIRGYLVFDS